MSSPRHGCTSEQNLEEASRIQGLLCSKPGHPKPPPETTPTPAREATSGRRCGLTSERFKVVSQLLPQANKGASSKSCRWALDLPGKQQAARNELAARG